jgi:hypothetical protein
MEQFRGRPAQDCVHARLFAGRHRVFVRNRPGSLAMQDGVHQIAMKTGQWLSFAVVTGGTRF